MQQGATTHYSLLITHHPHRRATFVQITMNIFKKAVVDMCKLTILIRIMAFQMVPSEAWGWVRSNGEEWYEGVHGTCSVGS